MDFIMKKLWIIIFLIITGCESSTFSMDSVGLNNGETYERLPKNFNEIDKKLYEHIINKKFQVHSMYNEKSNQDWVSECSAFFDIEQNFAAYHLDHLDFEEFFNILNAFSKKNESIKEDFLNFLKTQKHSNYKQIEQEFNDHNFGKVITLLGKTEKSTPVNNAFQMVQKFQKYIDKKPKNKYNFEDFFLFNTSDLHQRLFAIVRVWFSKNETMKSLLTDNQKKIIQEYLGCKTDEKIENRPESVKKGDYATKEEVLQISNRLKRVEGTVDMIQQNNNNILDKNYPKKKEDKK